MKTALQRAVSTTILAVNGLVVLLGAEERVMIKTTAYIGLSLRHGLVSGAAVETRDLRPLENVLEGPDWPQMIVAPQAARAPGGAASSRGKKRASDGVPK